MNLGRSIDALKQNTVLWLRQGMSPRRLALTLALGFAIGCIPVVGIPTLVCAVLALTLRLNLPAIQAANYLVMPLQLVLIVPFVRLGGWLMDADPTRSALGRAGLGRFALAGNLHHTSPLLFLSQMGGLAGQALLAWLVIAVPTVAVLTLALTLVLRRVPALAAAEAGD